MLVLLLLWGLPIATKADQAPQLLGEKGILFWDQEQKLSGYPNIHKIFPSRLIKGTEEPSLLPKSGAALSDFSYSYKGKMLDITDYFNQLNTTGLIVVKDKQVVLEQYALGHSKEKTWISFSIAKSVVSMLFGAAIKDGYINSVNDKATEYLPSLSRGAYNNVTIKDLLQMSSGVDWNEDYEDPNSDVASSPFRILQLLDYMDNLDSKSDPGKIFNYNTGETNLAGAVLRAAIGNNLSTYLHKKIWAPFGMESDAHWMLDEVDGVEYGGCCINATLRDYARLGLFAMHNGTLASGQQVLPDGWMKESTTSSPGSNIYGYYWWLKPNSSFRATGVFGQFIWIDPKENLVVAVHSAWDHAWRDAYYEHTEKLISSISAHLNKIQL